MKPNQTRLNDMLNDLRKLLELEIGTPDPRASVERIERALCVKYGGNTVYVHKSTKRNIVSRVIEYGTGMAAADVAACVGITPRYVRKIRKLMR
jgi:hypothetical protein